MIERTDLGYLCPTCTLLTQGLAEMPDADHSDANAFHAPVLFP